MLLAAIIGTFGASNVITGIYNGNNNRVVAGATTFAIAAILATAAKANQD